LVEEAAAVVPGDEQRGGIPFRSVHDSARDLADPVVACRHREPVVLTVDGELAARCDDGEVGESAGRRLLDEVPGEDVVGLLGVEAPGEGGPDIPRVPGAPGPGRRAGDPPRQASRVQLVHDGRLVLDRRGLEGTAVRQAEREVGYAARHLRDWTARLLPGRDV